MKHATVVAAIAGLAAAAPQSPTKARHLQSSLRAGITQSEKSTNWAGVAQVGTGFTRVEGVITVPKVSGSSQSAASAWVGIDGYNTQSILQTGVSFYADGTFDHWYEWLPDYAYTYPGTFDIKVGDQIKLAVEATTKSTGVSSLENLRTGQKVSHTFKHVLASLQEKNAEWIVEDFESGGSEIPLAQFGEVIFTNATATGSDGTVTPAGGHVINLITPQGKLLTDVTINGNNVDVKQLATS